MVFVLFSANNSEVTIFSVYPETDCLVGSCSRTFKEKELSFN